MEEEEFWDTTPRAFFNAVEGFMSLRKVDLEVTRLQTLYLMNAWISPQIMDPQKLWQYPWEDKKKAIDTGVQIERAKRVKDKFERIEKRHGE